MGEPDLSYFDDKFWLELREPGCSPQYKGSFPSASIARVLREFMDARPSAFITVVTISHFGPSFQDGPECLEMRDGRSKARAKRHRRSSALAFAERGVSLAHPRPCTASADASGTPDTQPEAKS